MPVTIDELVVADPPETWRDAGFTVDDDNVCRIGDVRVRLVGRADDAAADADADGVRGITAWSLREAEQDQPLGDLDGLPTATSTAAPCEPAAHPNGASHIDHVVLMSPDLDRTTRAFEAVGVAARRVRNFDVAGTPMRQVFFRLGPVILEVVGRPDHSDPGPATFWGLTHAVTDLNAAADLLGENLGPIKQAVQPGRRIATMRHRRLGMSVATALITLAPN